jgi:hypothetical protein
MNRVLALADFLDRLFGEVAGDASGAVHLR